MIGEQIGEFQLIKVIGEGGMSTVYRAYQPSFDRQVAIKLLPRQLAADSKSFRRFQHEARMIARLEHRSILPVYAYGEHEGMPYIVMRLLEEGSLRRRIYHQDLDLMTAARIVEQVAEALDYAHSQGVIHRDLKPSNILLDEHANAYLTDFGIAKLLGATTQITGSGVVGTPSYMSPEQCQGKRATPASDEYALGAIAFEMLTGRPPFEADTPLAVMYKQVRDPVPSVREVDSELPAAFDRVIGRAMAKKPESRYPTASALAADFRRVTQAFAAGAIPPAAAGGASPPGAGVGPPRRRGPEPPPSRRAMPTWLSAALLVMVGALVLAAAAIAGSYVMNGSLPFGLMPTATPFLQPMTPGGAASTGSTATPTASPTPPPTEPGRLIEPTALPSQTPVLVVVTDSAPEQAATPFGSGWLAFTQGTNENAEIWIMDENGLNLRQLTDNETYDGEPDWSPDGRQIAFESLRTGGLSPDIYVMDVDGSNVQRITTDAAPDRHPDWSPDGSALAYESGSGAESEIVVTTLDGEHTRLTNNDFGDRAPQFSPDGSWIAYMTEERGPWEIAILSYPQGELQGFYDCPGLDCRFPAWSPDGSTIVFNTLDEVGRVDAIYALDVDSGRSTPLVAEGQNGRATWGSGGAIFFNRTEDGDTSIFRLELDDNTLTRLTQQGVSSFGPDWGRYTP
jgi:tRNA A-37 threonylcarbamoyl transferase component Bud32